MLHELSVSTMISEEIITFSDRVVSVTVAPFDAILANRINKVKMFSGHLASAFNRNKKSDFTPLLALKDGERDNGFRSFKFAVLSAVYSNDPVIQAAGEKIQEVLKRHDPSLFRLGYVAQSAEMKSLKQELDNMSTEIEAAVVNRQYDAMVDSMTAFDNVFIQKTEVESGGKAPGIGASKKELSKQIILLLRQVQILIEDDEEGITTLVNKYNEVISSTMTLAKARQTRNLNNSASDQGTTEDSEIENS